MLHSQLQLAIVSQLLQHLCSVLKRFSENKKNIIIIIIKNCIISRTLFFPIIGFLYIINLVKALYLFSTT